jgi:hypothetical protein
MIKYLPCLTLNGWRGLVDFKILKETLNVINKSNKIFNPASWNLRLLPEGAPLEKVGTKNWKILHR